MSKVYTFDEATAAGIFPFYEVDERGVWKIDATGRHAVSASEVPPEITQHIREFSTPIL